METPDKLKLEWSSQFTLSSPATSSPLPGDKILLPQSALEQLLAAAPSSKISVPSSHPYPPDFDPYNPSSFAAERHARSQAQVERQQLPHPLTFRLVNPSNGRAVFAGIREFSAEEGHLILSQFLQAALGVGSALANGSKAQTAGHTDGEGQIDQQMSRITVHAASLAKGTYVKLRPLEAGYDPEDWKSLLEDYLRKNFTTLTKNEVLTVPAGREQYQFLVDVFKPPGDAICVVDTDLEVDIEALNEDQARETLRHIAAKKHQVASSTKTSSAGGKLDLFRHQTGQVLQGEYVHFQVESWARAQGLEVRLESPSVERLELFASPLAPHQRNRPLEDEHVFADWKGRPFKSIRLSPNNVEFEESEAVLVSVHAPQNDNVPPSTAESFTIQATVLDCTEKSTSLDESLRQPGPDESRCLNCKQIVPKQSLILHESFCHRNNVVCSSGCNRVFQKRSQEWENHWHCPEDDSFGDNSQSRKEHDRIFHTSYSCPSCAYPVTFMSLPALAQHRTTSCPGKPILCRFCHLVTPQDGNPDPASAPDPELLLSGLTPHELADGARTTECHLCWRIVRLRDMEMHLKHHDYQRLSRETPRPCRNVNCGRTLDGTGHNGDTRLGQRMGQGAGNDIGLCSTCFGPLYVSLHDPEGKALQRRVERRYLQQLITGCGKAWCRNEFCKTGRLSQINGVEGASDAATGARMQTKDASPLIKPFVQQLKEGVTPLHFCVDEASQKRRNLAGMLAAEGQQFPGARVYGLSWCLGALEAEAGDLDKARDWLKNYAPTTDEEKGR